ncbi:hypothetical protein BU26DRAFT_273657 [Trematosphaeria pertusa]|uniref:Uncharacterized protein n=1 Tax=Trematosphaeria pertusa TaxID=390896 RepID=A0A6A6IKL3_9PLEO|nr:uncharacterized protein BU26DRAFT_273657 [Trematosphaeria pertusa]KAF2250926.1 hypothetical protein BU26DRAFT_273657 [Trematosphaeria pertusa]
MLPQHVLLALVAAVAAVPLNINLGAYSPALVVGDGEISLGSAGSASELMATLASGAAENGNGQQGQQQEQQQEQPEGEGEQEQEQPAEENAAKRSLIETLDHLRKRSPEPANDHLAAMEDAVAWIKRDIEGFREALGYAREAQKDQPKVELGTGEEGSGVGIIVNPGLNVPANSAANGAPAQGERKAKRSEVVAEESEAPKMTLVAITEV